MTGRRQMFACALAGMSFVLAAPAAEAALLAYEGFNGYSSGDISGQTVVNTTGLQGAWTVTNVLPGGGLASSVVQSSGLSFGSNFAASSGGSLLSTSKYSGTNARTTATARLDATTTGTLWSSYLVNFTTLSLTNSGYGQQAIGTDSAGTTTQFSSQILSNAVATDRKLHAAYDATATTSFTNVPFATGTTYLLISKYTNVGTPLSTGTTGQATTWVFTQAGYDAWFADGADEAELANHDFTLRSDTAVTSGTFNFDSNGYVTLRADAPDLNNAQTVAVFDEVRYGTTLTDVIAIPEPGTATFVMLGAAGVLLRRRSKSAC